MSSGLHGPTVTTQRTASVETWSHHPWIFDFGSAHNSHGCVRAHIRLFGEVFQRFESSSRARTLFCLRGSLPVVSCREWQWFLVFFFIEECCRHDPYGGVKVVSLSLFQVEEKRSCHFLILPLFWYVPNKFVSPLFHCICVSTDLPVLFGFTPCDVHVLHSCHDAIYNPFMTGSPGAGTEVSCAGAQSRTATAAHVLQRFEEPKSASEICTDSCRVVAPQRTRFERSAPL